MEAFTEVDHPMYVVTATDGEARAGCLVGFATPCSIDPPRFLVCVSVRNHTHGVVRHATTVAVHLLRQTQVDLAALFGSETGDETDKFAQCAWTPGPDGVPVLSGCAAWFAGRIVKRVELGDHDGVVLAPVTGGGSADDVLTFARVRNLPPGHEP